MEYETEEQQLEAIKQWWKENSSLVFIGVAIGVSSIFGWQYYQSNEINRTQHASVIYERVMINSENPAKISEQLASVNELEADFDDTPYASLSALIVAKQNLGEGATDKAEQLYRWVMENSTQDELKYIAKIRLSRLLLTVDKQDEALKLLNESYPESYNGMVLELKGDVFTLQGNKTEARMAYIKAKALSEGGNRWLQLKIDDLGTGVPAIKSSVKSIAEKPAA